MKVEPFRREFIVNRQGTDFCLLKGLVDTAHRSGLRSIHTHLVQAPTTENDMFAIMHATATFIDAEGAEYQFEGIGDASPQNVGRMITLHVLRMAESRAIARALRFALNVGDTALEELSDGEETSHHHSAVAHAEQAEQTPIPLRAQQRSEHVAPAAIEPGGPATKEQIARLHKLQAALGRPALVPPELTAEQAASQISELVKVFNSQARGGKAGQ